MGWLFIALGAAVLLWGFPFLRCAIKRLQLQSKLKKQCANSNLRLVPLHTLWFFGNKHCKKCDVCVESPKDVYVIKLFGLPRRQRELMLLPDSRYSIRHTIAIVGVGMAIYTFNGRTKQIPSYRFDAVGELTGTEKRLHRILLVHPIAMAIHHRLPSGAEKTVQNGDTVDGAEIFSLSGLLDHLATESNNCP